MRDPQATSAGQRDGVVIRPTRRNHDGSIFGRNHDDMVIVARRGFRFVFCGMEGIGHVTLSYSVLIMPRLATGIAGWGAICVTFGGRRQAAGNWHEGVPPRSPS